MTSAKVMTVTRSGLASPLSTLNINDESTYWLLYDGFDPGAIRWERNMVGSPYVDGDYEVSKRKRNTEVEVSLVVKASTQTALQAAVDALVDDVTGAFCGQYTYTVTTTIAGVAWSWTCFAADYSTDWRGNWIDGVNGAGPFELPMTLAIPRLPNPVAGPI